MIWTMIVAILMAFGVLFGFLTHKTSQKIRQLKNESGAFNYSEDTLIVEKTLAGNHNKAFKNELPSQTFIDQYILSYEDNKVYFVGKPLIEFSADDVLEIHCFNSNKQITKTIYLRATNKTELLLPIELPNKTAFVNLYMYHSTADTKPILESFKHKYDMWVKLFKQSSLALFFIQIPVGYFLLMMLSGDRFESLLNVQTITLGLALMIGIAVFNYVFIKTSFHRKYPI